MHIRPYQERIINRLLKLWERKKSILVQSNTGSGKTIMFSEVSQRLLNKAVEENFYCKILILAHRKELLTQAWEKINFATGLTPSFIRSGEELDLDNNVQIASVQTMPKFMREYGNPDLFTHIVIDEAHHSVKPSYTKIFEHYPNAKRAGFTATPTRPGNDADLADYYEDIICGPQTSELIKNGYITDVKLKATVSSMNLEGVSLSAGDYKTSDVTAANPSGPLAESLAKVHLEEIFGRQTIIFAASVEHSKAFEKTYNAYGIPCRHVDSDTPPLERDRSIYEFNQGIVRVITNVGLFDEGLDAPFVEAIQIARPTTSLIRWLQMNGRGMRPAPGKKHCITIDHTANFKSLGHPTADRRWYLNSLVEEEDKREVNRGPNMNPISSVSSQLQAKPIDDAIVDITLKQTQKIVSNQEYVKRTRAIYGSLLRAGMNGETRSYTKDQWYSAVRYIRAYMKFKGYRDGWCAYTLYYLGAPAYAFILLEGILQKNKGWGKFMFGKTNSECSGDNKVEALKKRS